MARVIIIRHSAHLLNSKYKHFNSPEDSGSIEQRATDWGGVYTMGHLNRPLTEESDFAQWITGEWWSRWMAQHRQKCGRLKTKVASSDVGLGFCIRLGSLGS